MKSLMWILFAGLVFGVGILLAKMNKGHDTPISEDNPYLGLRNSIFGITAERLGVKGDGKSMLAAIMEMGVSGGSATMVMTEDGAVSMYYSSGGGMIGAGEHEHIRKQARKYLDHAAKLVPSMRKVQENPLPEEGVVHFYAIRQDGAYFLAAKEADLMQGVEGWTELYSDGQDVMALLREYQESKGIGPK